jgi:hypothetical protein
MPTAPEATGAAFVLSGQLAGRTQMTNLVLAGHDVKPPVPDEGETGVEMTAWALWPAPAVI